MTPCRQVRYVFSDPSLTSYRKCISRLVIAVDDASSTWAPLNVREVNERHILGHFLCCLLCVCVAACYVMRGCDDCFVLIDRQHLFDMNVMDGYRQGRLSVGVSKQTNKQWSREISTSTHL